MFLVPDMYKLRSPEVFLETPSLRQNDSNDLASKDSAPGTRISRPRKLGDLKEQLSGSGFRLGEPATGLRALVVLFGCFVGWLCKRAFLAAQHFSLVVHWLEQACECSGVSYSQAKGSSMIP